MAAFSGNNFLHDSANSLQQPGQHQQTRGVLQHNLPPVVHQVSLVAAKILYCMLCCYCIITNIAISKVGTFCINWHNFASGCCSNRKPQHNWACHSKLITYLTAPAISLLIKQASANALHPSCISSCTLPWVQ